MSFKIHELEGYVQTIYLVEEKNGLFLLDGCCRPDVEIVLSFIENKLNKSIDDLKLVIATHAHPDHMGGLSFFKRKGIPIAGPKGLNNWYSGISGFFTYCVDLLLTHLVAINKKKRFKNIIFPRSITLDYILHEEGEVPGFSNWKTLECPGHTDVDLTIYHSEKKLAYVADNFVGSKRNVFRPYPLVSPCKYKVSLKRYIDLGIEDFLLAHFGSVKISRERIEMLIETTPSKPRIHINTLPAILIKLFKSITKKFH